MATNETHQIVIRPDGAIPDSYLGGPLLALAIEDSGGSRAHSLVSRHFDFEYAVISNLCSTRAVHTVGGDLTVQGKRIEPEAYLQLWRKAIATAMSPQSAADAAGIVVEVCIRGNVRRQAKMPASLTTDPCREGFDGWRGAFEDCMRVDDDGYFELLMDLREPQAYLAWYFMPRYADYKDARCSSEIRVRMESRPIARQVPTLQVQECLF